jgi:hypothetical protein
MFLSANNKGIWDILLSVIQENMVLCQCSNWFDINVWLLALHGKSRWIVMDSKEAPSEGFRAKSRNLQSSRITGGA